MTDDITYTIDSKTMDALGADARGAEDAFLVWYVPDADKDIYAWEADIKDELANWRVDIYRDIEASDNYDRFIKAKASRIAIDTWATRQEPVASRQSAWYDETDYIVPANGLTAEQFRSALYDAWRTSLTGWSVGGYSTPSVKDNGDGTLTVTSLYHIGD